MKKFEQVLKKILLSFIVICFVSLLFTYSSFTVSANTVNTGNDVSTYVDNDKLLNSSNYTIHDYPDLIATRGAVAKQGGFLGGFKFQYMGTDDPIVEIIPKELFYTECSQAIMGEEYGFYIKTTPAGAENKKYISTVLVFDIYTNTDLITNNDRVIVKVEPLFQYNYVCLSGSGSAGLHGFYMAYNVDEPWVIPYPSKMTNTTFDFSLEYNMDEKYFIKDVSFGASLYNEQSLNKGDSGYDPYNDYGSYFTGFDYSFNGKYREYGEFSGEDLGMNIADTVMYGLGFLDAIPVVGTVTAIIGQIYDTVMLGKDWIEFGVDTYTDLTGTIESVDKKITATCYYQNRDDQLSHYRDKNNKPYLVKTAALGINTNSEQSIWYGVNDDATAYFNVNHSALNGRNPEYTRFTNHIALKIVDSSGDTVIATTDKITTNNLRNQNVKKISMENTESLYMLQRGMDCYSFDAEFTSNYNILIKASENIRVSINDQTYLGSNLNIKLLIHRGQNVSIKIDGNNNTTIGTIRISPDDDTSNLSIQAKEKYLIGIDSLNGIKKLKTNYSNILIEKIYYMSNNQLISYESYGSYLADDNLTYVFKNHSKFYIVLQNNLTYSVSNASLTLNDIESIEVGYTSNVYLTPNISYFRLSNVTGGQYVQTITNASSGNFIYKVLDSNYNVITNGYSYTNGEYIISLDSNKTYYIGITNGSDNSNAKLTINSRENAYQWEVIGGQYSSGYKTFERDIYLKRGYTYTFKFWINNQISSSAIFSEDDPYNYYGGYNISITSSGKLSIPVTTPIRGSGIIVKAKYFQTDASYDHTIRVIPEFENSITNLTTYNNEELQFSFVSPKYLKSIDYTLSIGNTSKNFNLSISDYNSSNFVSINILDNYYSLGYNGVGLITIKIFKMNVATAVNGTASYDCNYTLSVHNLFYGGDGSNLNPYLISSYRHLNNMRTFSYSIYGSFKLMNDIYCPWTTTNYYWDASWEILPNFYGVFDGENHKIIRSNIVIDRNDSFTDSEQGFFRVNYGTIKNLILYDAGTNTYGQYGFNPNKTIYSGMFCGSNYGTIENCSYNSLDTTMCFFVPNAYVGGITGWNSGKIIGCTVTVWNIDGYGNKGGITGWNSSNGLIENCIVYGSISNRYTDASQSEQYSVGGIVGINYGKVNACVNYATISFSKGTTFDSRTLQPRMGSIIGTNSGSYTNCSNYGSVNTSGLQTINWTTGSLWWKENHSFNQALYAGGICGQTL